MPTPLDLVRKYFRSATSLPDPRSIAPADVLDQVAGTFVPALSPLRYFQLTPAEQVSFGGKDPIDQRHRSQAFLGLILKRPALGERAGVEPKVFQVVIDKDDTSDLLSNTLGQLGQIAADGALVVSAEASRQVVSALTWVKGSLLARTLPAANLRRLQICFNSVDLTGVAATTRADGKATRLQAGQRPAREALGAASALRDEQAQNGLLGEAAAKGYDLSLQQPAPAPRKTTGRTGRTQKGQAPKGKRPGRSGGSRGTGRGSKGNKKKGGNQ